MGRQMAKLMVALALALTGYVAAPNSAAAGAALAQASVAGDRAVGAVDQVGYRRGRGYHKGHRHRRGYHKGHRHHRGYHKGHRRHRGYARHRRGKRYAYRHHRPRYYHRKRYRRRYYGPKIVIRRPCVKRIIRYTPYGKVVRIVRTCGYGYGYGPYAGYYGY